MIQPRIRQNPFETYEEVAEGFERFMRHWNCFDREYQGHLDLGTQERFILKGHVMRRHFTTIMGTRSL